MRGGRAGYSTRMAEHKKNKRKAGAPEVELTGRALSLLDSYEGCGTVSDLCEYLGIKNTTFYKWFNNDDQFAEAVQRAREFTDDAVENAMLKRALGFEYIETTEKAEDGEKDGSGKTSNIVRKVYVPGDVGAQKNWLSNRRPDRWREKKTIELTGSYHDLLAQFADEDDTPEAEGGA